MGAFSNISAGAKVTAYNSVMEMSRAMDPAKRMSAAGMMGQPSRLLEMMKYDPDSRVKLSSAQRLIEVGNTQQRIMARDYICRHSGADTLPSDINISAEDPAQGRIRDSRDFISVILAGGAGSRFARDASVPDIEEDCKILAPLDGQPLIHHILNMLPTSDAIVATPGDRNPAWDKRIREALTHGQSLRELYGKYIHYADRSDNDWMVSFSIAVQKARDLGYRSAFVLMGDSFLDANQKDAMSKAMLSPFENVIFYSNYGSGRRVITAGIPDINGVGRVEDYRVLDIDSPEGRMEILYMISVQDYLSFWENNEGSSLDRFFDHLADRQTTDAGRDILGAVPLSIRHSDININTKSQLRELNRHIYGSPYTWWGNFSQFGRCYPDVLGMGLLPDIEELAGLPQGMVDPVQINSKGAVFKWKSHGRAAYIKIFAPEEMGAMRHRNNHLAHRMFPELFPALRYHGTIKGYLVDVEEDLEAQGKRPLDRIIGDMNWQDVLDQNDPGNAEVRDTLFKILTELKKNPFEGSAPDFRFPALQIPVPLHIAQEGAASLFPQPSPDLPIGFEYFGRYMENIRGAFERVREKRPEAAQISDSLNQLCFRMSEASERVERLFEKDKELFYSHGDLMPYNIFLPDKVLDGEYFHVAPFSFELATLITGMAGIFSESDRDFTAYGTEFIRGFAELFGKYEAGSSGAGSVNYVENTPLLPLITLKLMQETYHEYFHKGLNAVSCGRIGRSLELAKNLAGLISD